MNTEKALESLVSKFGKQDWFDSVSVEPEFGKDIVLYTKKMSADILKEVPEQVEDIRVRLHFAAYKEPLIAKPIVIEAAIEEKEEETIDLPVVLWTLKKVCGPENLDTILAEVHDDKIVQTFSKEFPSVRIEMEKLYSIFGFDVLFDELN